MVTVIAVVFFVVVSAADVVAAVAAIVCWLRVGSWEMGMKIKVRNDFVFYCSVIISDNDIVASTTIPSYTGIIFTCIH